MAPSFSRRSFPTSSFLDLHAQNKESRLSGFGLDSFADFVLTF
jgi:hypothetical protein